MSHKISRVVMTTGVSAWSPANQYRDWAESNSLLLFPTTSPNPQPPTGKTEKQAIKALENQCAIPNGLAAVSDQKKVSAEYSGLAALRNADRLGDHPQVVLIHTDSLGGKAAAVLVAMLLERDFGAQVECHSVTLDVADRERLRYGLGNFMQLVANALRDYDTSTTCFMPLGGYKVMTSLGYLAGAYFGFPTLYTHEDGQILHEVPAVPVRVPRTELESLAPLMKRIGKGIELAHLDEADNKSVIDHSWLFEIADGLVSVNAFGLFLMQEPENLTLFATKVFASEQVNAALGQGGQKKFILQQLGSLAGKLAAGSNEQDLQHEKQWGLQSGRGQHLYKGASNGILPFRCLYRFADDTLYVEHVWTNHDAYEKQAKIEWEKAPETLHDLTERIGGKA